MRNLILSFIILSLAACSGVYEQSQKLDDLIWKKGQVFAFDVEIEETTSPYEIYASVRHVDQFQLHDIKTIIRYNGPGQEPVEFPFVFTLANEHGKWLGEGMGDIWDMEQRVIDLMHMTKTGTWHFEIEHDMEYDGLPGIMEVGMAVRKKGQ